MTRATRYYNSIRDDRNAWRAQFDRCMLCQKPERNAWPAHQVHEIEQRGHADDWAQDVNYLFLCDGCHKEVHRWKKPESHAKQLALKWQRDRTHETLEAMLAAWRDVGGRWETYVTVSDVEFYLGEFSDGE